MDILRQGGIGISMAKIKNGRIIACRDDFEWVKREMIGKRAAGAVEIKYFAR